MGREHSGWTREACAGHSVSAKRATLCHLNECNRLSGGHVLGQEQALWADDRIWAPCSHPRGWDGETEAQRGQGMSPRPQSWTEERSPGPGRECQRLHSLHCPLGAGPVSQPGTWALDMRPAPPSPSRQGGALSLHSRGPCGQGCQQERCSGPPGSLPTRPALSPPLQILLQECVKARPRTRARGLQLPVTAVA